MSCGKKNKNQNDCPCDIRTFPPKNEIYAGLSNIPRQTARFSEFRSVLLSGIRNKESLNHWRPRGLKDAGTQLVEMWSYICDVLSFYDEVIAHESYIRTSRLRKSLRKLTGLLGYLPKPAVAATAELAVIAEDNENILIPESTAFRSGGFDDEAPQIFESDSVLMANPNNNEWSLTPPLPKTIPTGDHNCLYIDGTNASVSKGDTIIVIVEDYLSSVNLVEDVIHFSDDFGNQFQKLTFAEENSLFIKPMPYERGPSSVENRHEIVPQLNLNTVNLPARTSERIVGFDFTPHLKLKKSKIDFEQVDLYRSTNIATIKGVDPTNNALILDQLYPSLKIKEPVLIENAANNGFFFSAIAEIKEDNVSEDYSVEYKKDKRHFDISASKKVSRIKLSDYGDITASNKPIKIHYNLKKAGAIKYPPPKFGKAVGSWDIFSPTGQVANTKFPAHFIFQDKNKIALKADGTINLKDEKLNILSDKNNRPNLTAPVCAYGNILNISRGESVHREILGSGDASIPNQAFALKKNPLTYIQAPTADNDQGIQNTLKVWVNGVRWNEVPHFYSVSKDEQVYTVRQDDDGKSRVIFGDGITGSRLPTGIDNVVASYRFGAGAISPPANLITQMAKPVKGIKSVLNPLPASGGMDAEKRQTMRINGPNAALLLNRAVSISDMEAISANYLDIRSVKAQWCWQDDLQRPAVSIWYIGSKSTAEPLYKKLRSFSDPSVVIFVNHAKPVDVKLSVTLEIDKRRIKNNVIKNVYSVLLNKQSGILANEQIGIGRPLYRSCLFKEILSVKGVTNVDSLSWNDAPFTNFGKMPGEGCYYNFEDNHLVIN